MTTTAVTITNPTNAALGRAKRLGVAALVTTTVAILAGLTLIAIEPAEGSTLEGSLGFVAAVSGLATAVLAISAVVYAEAKGLWTRFPITGRGVLWAFLAVGIVRTVWSQVSHLV